MSKESFGQYKVESELGRGGMGVVFKAHDEALNRHVAIKVLSEQLATDESVVERFKREAKSMAALNDARIIQIYFIGEDEGQPYFVMEYVEGESLSERLKRDGRLPIAEALEILRQAAEGLAVAHDRGVVHRDIKPGNLMLGSNGNVKLADFGIAMVQDLSKRLTNTGEFVGTPGYLSPEVCVGQPVDQRSDIFALGIVLYEMLTGDIPFTEASPLGMMLEVVKAEIPDVRSVNAEVDERTCQILARMIAKDPDQRYPDCHELLADLKGNNPIAAPPPVEGPGAANNAFNQARTTALSQLESIPELGTGSVEATRVSGPGNQLPPQAAAAAAAETPTSSGPRWLPAAIAALLLVGIAGGAAFVFQDQLFSDGANDEPVMAKAQSLDDDESIDPVAGEAGESDETISGEDLEQALLAASSEVADSDAVETETTSETAAAATGSEKIAMADATTPSGGSVAGTTPEPSTEPAELTAAVATQPEAQKAATTTAQVVDQQQSVAQVTTPVTAQPAPAKAEPLQVASVSPAVSQPAADPRMVVVAVGDRALAGPVEQLLENALLDRELDVLDEAFFPDIGVFANEQGVDLAGLSGLIQDNGGDVLVLAEIDYIGETQLQYYGQFSTLYSVNVKIRNISLRDRRPLGRGWTRKVDFTTLNADEKAKEEVGPIVDDVAAALVNYSQR
ncbi:MAG: protein kinase [Pseudomonadota bacterium]